MDACFLDFEVTVILQDGGSGTDEVAADFSGEEARFLTDRLQEGGDLCADDDLTDCFWHVVDAFEENLSFLYAVQQVPDGAGEADVAVTVLLHGTPVGETEVRVEAVGDELPLLRECMEVCADPGSRPELEAFLVRTDEAVRDTFGYSIRFLG